MDYLRAKFGDFSFSRFGFIVRTNRRKVSQSGSTLHSRDRPTVGVSNYDAEAMFLTAMLCDYYRLSVIDTNDVTGRSRRLVSAAAAAAEFTTYDVTEIHLHTSDGEPLDTTKLTVSALPL